jgi:hypothetical protein
MRRLMPLLFLIAAACSQSHERLCGGRPAPDPACVCTAAETWDCSATGCTGSIPSCVTPRTGVLGPGAHCGDVVISAMCTGGRWTCERGFLDTEVRCDCFGRPSSGCSCTTSGWVCGGGDAGPPCPTSLDAAGSACSAELQVCNVCNNTGLCSRCAQLVCTGGAWELRAEPGPRPIPLPQCYPCGPALLSCQPYYEYCHDEIDDGLPEGRHNYTCRPLPSGCDNCGCLTDVDTCGEGPAPGEIHTSQCTRRLCD